MKIQFLKNIKSAILPDIPEDTYIIYRDGYELPDIKGVKGIIEFEKFKEIYSNLHANMYILVGLNRIITPSNRTNFVFEHLFTLSADVPKISLDTEPFIGEPWRLWFHYGVTKTGKFGIPYSYAIETEWQHWFYRNGNESRFSPDNLELCITDTYSNLDKLIYISEFYEPTNNDFEWYEEIKTFVFDKYNSPKLFINNILKLCNARFKLKYGFDSYKENTKFVLPELNIYRFVDEENKRRIGAYNRIIEISSNENIQ